mmetsp:Transcript_17854/g.49928  ORF Transcript_17854/g.49928 Transcript_17854/m.49928 type:complete len:98 (-) Transcript_17854:1633-1926(-)
MDLRDLQLIISARSTPTVQADTWDTGSSWASSSASQLSVSSRSRWGGGICLGCGGWSAAPNLKAQLFQILELFPADLGASSQLYLGWPLRQVAPLWL